VLSISIEIILFFFLCEIYIIAIDYIHSFTDWFNDDNVVLENYKL